MKDLFGDSDEDEDEDGDDTPVGKNSVEASDAANTKVPAVFHVLQ